MTTHPVTLTVDLVDRPDGAEADLAAQLYGEAARLRRAFAFATETSPIRATIANLTALADSLRTATTPEETTTP